MKNLNGILLVLVFVVTSLVSAQENRKEIEAIRAERAPKIDGVLDESIWENAAISTDFRMWRPGNGDAIPDKYKTEVKVIYDDDAIYFGAYMKDPSPKDIPKQFGARNSFPQADFFGIIINPYDDKITEFEFFIMSTGIQADAISVEDAEDENWNQVWKSAVKIVDDGWVVEVKIPYAALRFPKKEVQNWGLNFHRRIRKTNEQYSWNFIDKSKGLRSQQAGLLKNLKNLKPPLRLSLTPYTFFAVQNEDKTTDTRFSAGMDLKLGLSDSYTLDAVLVPEFGQVAFDEDILILSPFEQQFSENRAFFTEGTNLFSIGDLFYSRRIGQTPNLVDIGSNRVYDNLQDGIPLVNALKISGRGNKGLGIGVFNAITERTTTSVTDITTQEKEEIEISPLTNYNVLVFDQQFNKNSSISFVNTNVLREGNFEDANVSALVLNLINKNNYFLTASSKLSINNNENGFGSEFKIGKRSGKFQYEYSNQINDEKFDINDLGFQLNNNFHINSALVSYRIFEPTERLNTFNISLNTTINALYKPSTYTGNEVSLSTTMTTKKQSFISSQLIANIGSQKDYRYKSLVVDDTYFETPTQLGFRVQLNSDLRKKFNYIVGGFYSNQISNNTSSLELLVNPSMRLSDKWAFSYKYNYTRRMNERGYVNTSENESIFGNRLVQTFENTIKSTYYLNTDIFIDFSLRHFWTPVEYDDTFYSLQSNGRLLENDYESNHDLNYNSWNVNLNFFWQFAPGSQLIAQYRNAIRSTGDNSMLTFNENLRNLFKQPAIANFSIKVLYFLDVNRLKRRVPKHKTM